MSKNLQEHLAAVAAEQIPLWIDGWRYGEKLLRKGSSPWGEVASLVSFFNQLQSLVKSDVLTIDLENYYEYWLKSHPSLLGKMAAKNRLGFALRTLLADPEARSHFKEIVSAICDVHKGTPVLISFPSPRHWLGAAHCTAKQVQRVEVSWQEAESGAIYLADFLREFSGCGLSGIVFREEGGDAPCSNDEIAHYQPLINVAKHYGWSVVLDGCADDFQPGPEVGVTLCLGSANEKIQGRKLASSFWTGDCSGDTALADNQFWFVDIPVDAIPEQVLDALATLREKS